jgi:hypothetical protein
MTKEQVDTFEKLQAQLGVYIQRLLPFQKNLKMMHLTNSN